MLSSNYSKVHGIFYRSPAKSTTGSPQFPCVLRKILLAVWRFLHMPGVWILTVANSQCNMGLKIVQRYALEVIAVIFRASPCLGLSVRVFQ